MPRTMPPSLRRLAKPCRSFRVISERTFEVGEEGGIPVFLHDMDLRNAYGKPIDLKVTNPEDLAHAERLLSAGSGPAALG